MHIAPANPQDRDALLALIQSAYRGESSRAGWTTEADLLGGQRTDPEGLDAIFANPKQTLLAARQDGDLVGCIALTDKGAGRHYFGMLTIAPTQQGAGLGKQLLAAAEQQARDAGASVMEMWVIKQRADLIAWYERRGYLATGRHEPFPMADPRFGLPKRDDLEFAVFEKPLG
ncbi:GNAT family N-acetyltransferase [Sphingomicrobium flavum]|uniref:GNAT family N-acetyltransferase n=1 Tax=Sphingomicrobium flavum TaxID=1229164 RepID=UPI0021AD7D83|nr:GNAT family N-acetyltransferase [Sphingomicrobium flavum]